MSRTDTQQPGSLLNGYSFEISAKDAIRLDAIRAIVPSGTIVSITYLPSETDDARIAAARQVRELGFIPMPHVAARRIPSADGLQRFLNRLAIEAQVDRLFVIAGDSAEPAGPFVDALSVITGAQLGDHGIRSIGIAGYPEGHPQISTDKLNRALADKSAALTDFGFSGEIVTQFAFDADPMLTWVAGLRAAGIRMPVRLGLPGPANVGTLLRFAARCGVGASTKVLAKYGASITKLLHTAGPDHLYNDLARSIEMEQHGAVAVHLYPFGGLQKMADWAHTTKSRTN